MADYYTVLQRAVAALPENTGAGRRAIYDKARAALVRQLETIQPPLPAAEIAKQRLSLEEAVRRIEADVARSATPRPTAPAEPRREPPRPPPARPEPPRPEAPRPESARPEPPRQEPARQEPARQEPARQEPPRQEQPDRPEPPRAEAPRPEAARAAPPPVAPRPDPIPGPEPVRVPAPPRAEPPSAEAETPVAPRRPDPVRPAPRIDAPVRGEPSATGPRADGAAPAKAAPPLDAMRREPADDDAASRPAAPRIAVRRAGEVDAATPAPRLDMTRPVPPIVPAPPVEETDDSESETGDDRGRSREERQARKEKRRLARLGRAEEPAADRDADAPHDDTRAPAETDAEPDDADWPAVAADAPPLRLPKRRRRNYGPLIAALVVLVLVAGGGALAYVYRDTLLAQVEALVAEEPPAQRRTATPAQPNGEPLVAKDEDRLPAANGQNGAAPGADTATPPGTPADTRAVNTTRIVTPQTTPTSDPAAPVDGEPAPGTTPADGSAAPADAQEVAPNAEAAGMTGPSRGILYEEGETAGAKGAALDGDVKWEMVRESIGGAPPEPIVRATIAVPERQATTTIIFRRNRDDALPASHLIEVAFELPVEFPGGGISNLPGLIMKVTENARGDALIGASARVSDGLFWIALSASETDETHNLELLKDRGWIDLPMLYDNGRRAILTVEKGSAGAAAIDEAITAWAAEPAN